MRNGLAGVAVCLLFIFGACSGDVVEPEVRAVPQVLTIIDGDGQEATVAAALGSPLVVQVTDSAGTEFPGVSVIWSTADGSVGAATTTTDAFGFAAVNWTLGQTAGAQTVQASVAGVAPQTFTAVALPGSVASLEIVEDSLSFLVGDMYGFSALAADVYENAVEAPRVVWMSLDSAVAQIDSLTAELVAVGSGTAEITATVAGEATDTVAVTVQEPATSLPVNWYRTYPLTGRTLTDVWAASADAIFAVGDAVGGAVELEEPDAAILFFDGTYWTRMTVPAGTPALHSVWGTSATDVFAVGEAGAILHYDGSSWTTMTSPTTEHLSGVGGTSSSNVYAVGHDGGIFRYDGSAWTVVFSGSLVELHDVWATSATNVYVVGSGGVIRHWDGTNWQAMVTPTTAALYGIWGSGENDIYAVGAGGMVLHYDGTAWVERTTVGATGTLRSVTGASNTRVMVVGSDGAYRYDGSAWTPMTHTLNPGFYGATADVTGAIHVAGGAGAIFRNGSAANWQIAHSTAAATAIWAVSDTEAFRVGAHGTILRFDGTGWIAMESPTTADLVSVWANDGQSVYAVGADQVFYYDGTTWAERFVDPAGNIGGVHGLGLNDVYIASGSGVTRFDGNAWTVVDSTAFMLAVHADTSGEVHATGGASAVRFDGTTWTPLTNTAGGSFGSALWGDSPTYMLACFTSTNAAHYDGEHWQQNETAASCRDVHGTSRYDIFVVGDGGQIHHRSGTGLGWTSLTRADITSMLTAVHVTAARVFVGSTTGLILHGDR